MLAIGVNYFIALEGDLVLASNCAQESVFWLL
jgi:hypothetical protein